MDGTIKRHRSFECRADHVAAVGDGDRGHFGLARQGGDLVGLDGALAERIGGVDAEVDEIGVGHGGSMGMGAESGQGIVGHRAQR